jgi:hypothetical protein
VIHNKKKANSFEHGTSQIINGSWIVVIMVHWYQQ